MRKDDLDAGKSSSGPDVVVVAAGGADADEAVIWPGLWLGHVLKAQLVDLAVLVEDDRFQGPSLLLRMGAWARAAILAAPKTYGSRNGSSRAWMKARSPWAFRISSRFCPSGVVASY